MKGKLGDKVRLMHILDAINDIETYLHENLYEQFLERSEKLFATKLRLLEKHATYALMD